MEPRRSGRANKGQHPNQWDHEKNVGETQKSKVSQVKNMEKEDEGIIRCYCGNNVDDGEVMIQCDKCEKWQHGVCMGYASEDMLPKKYFCELCAPETHPDLDVFSSKSEQQDVQPLSMSEASKPAVRAKSSTPGLEAPKVQQESQTLKRKSPATAESQDSEFEIPDNNTTARRQSKARKVEQKPRSVSPTIAKQSKAISSSTTRRSSVSMSSNRKPSIPAAELSALEPVSKISDLADATRKGVATQLQKVFSSMDTSSEQSKSESLAIDVEQALFSHVGSSPPEYRNKFRSILFNLKDAKNKQLSERVYRGDIAPDRFVRMTNEEMANPELQAEAERIREEGVENSVIKIQDGPRIRRTHKGEEYVGDDTEMVSPMDVPATFTVRDRGSVDLASVSVEQQNAKGTPVSPVSGTFGDKGSSPRSPEHEIAAAATSLGKRLSSSSSGGDFNIQDVWSHLESPKSPHEHKLPTLEATVPPDNQNVLQDPDIDRLLENPSRADTPPYSPSSYNFEVSESVLTKSPPVWTGQLSMLGVATIQVQARFVGGSLYVGDLPWETIFPPERVNVDGRIAIESTRKYLAAVRQSSTKQVIAISFEPESEEQEDLFEQFFKHFEEKERYGVLGMKSGGFVKDAYLIPLAVGAEIPDFVKVMDSHEIPSSRSRPLFLGMLVLHKNIAARGSGAKPSPTVQRPQQSVLINPPQNSPPIDQTQLSPPPPAQLPQLTQADIAALQALVLARPDILQDPAVMSNPALLQSLLEQYAGEGSKPQNW